MKFLNRETHTPVLLMKYLWSPYSRDVKIWVSTVFILICLKTDPRRRRNSGAAPRAEKFGDLITADHKVLSFECRCLTHGEPDRNGSHSYPWLMAAHLASGIAADSPEEFEKFLLDLQPQVRTCLFLSPSTTFSIDIETCYPVDTVHNSPINEFKQGMKELVSKFDAQTIRTVAKLHDQFGHPSAKGSGLMSYT